MKSKPWNDEPDFARWIDQATGLRCVIRRASFGNLCGYVRVPRGRLRKKLWRRGYDHPLISGIEVHGGLTFCGKPRDYRMKGLWIGFDCAHAFDLVPGFLELGFSCAETGTYRDFGYVRREVQELAAQLKLIVEATK